MEFQLVEAKNVNVKIKLMEWNPKYDTIAVCDMHNELLVHRITWQKAIWSKKTCDKNFDICGISWCPNGKILAVCYNVEKKVYLLSHEDGSLIYILNLNYEFSIIKWFQTSKDMSSINIFGEDLKIDDYKRVIKTYMPSETYNSMAKVLGNDTIDLYSKNPPFVKSSIIPPLPRISDKMPEIFSKFDGDRDNIESMTNPISNFSLMPYWTTKYTEKDSNLYLLGIVENGPLCLHVYVNGLYQILSIPLHNDLQKIQQFTTSPNLQYILFHGSSNKLEVQNVTEGDSMQLLLIKQMNDKFYLRDDWREINATTRILFGSETKEGISSILGYIGMSVEYLKEIWESVLLEIDSKFSAILAKRFEANYNGPKFCDELLELITWGTMSPELCTIFMNELKIEELTKIANVVETNYVKLQNVLEKNLKLASLKLVDRLAQLKNFFKWDARFGHLLSSLSNDDSFNVPKNPYDLYIKNASDFCLKIAEMQRVLRASAKNYKTFFKWLIKVAQELKGSSETQNTKEEELSPLSLDEAKEIIDFIYDTFDFEYDPNIKVRVHLDKFGQYLKSSNTEQINMGGATTLLEQYHTLLFNFQELCDAIKDKYTLTFAANVKFCPISTNLLPSNEFASSIHFDASSQIFYILAKCLNSTLKLLKINTLDSSCQTTTLNYSQITQPQSTVCEALIYGQESGICNLSIITTQNGDVKNKCYWINVGLKNTELFPLEELNITTLPNYHCKNLSNFVAEMMAINISRKLACLYSPTQGKIQIYEGA